ncbi:MAG: 2Fe-2S iron-sulfur cluster-binding protein [Methylophilus sp.]|nr:2Fe-2S iron-sulfur cluster-binding protein [Methylophilus sp.]
MSNLGGDNAAIAWSGFRTFKVNRKIFEDSSQSICSFYLVPEDGQPLPTFFPGQFLTFRVDVPTNTGGIEQIIRCYSLSDAPHTDYYRVSIKRLPQSIGNDAPPGRSSNHFHDHITTGSLLQVRAPSGHFYIDNSDAPVVLIGGGIGITPMLSMLNWCLANQTGREVWLFYGVRNSQELVMKSHLEKLASAHTNFHLWICFCNPLPEDVASRDFRHQGRVDINLLRTQLPLKPYHFYICGPSPMMESLVSALDDWGVPDTHIHFEAFGPATIKRHNTAALVTATQTGAADTGIIVNFALSGKQLPWQLSANNLLEFAEANGISVNSGCRAGGCGTCQTAIRSGEVAYRQPPDFDPEPGTCLLCVCIPKTSLKLEV